MLGLWRLVLEIRARGGGVLWVGISIDLGTVARYQFVVIILAYFYIYTVTHVKTGTATPLAQSFVFL